VIFDVRLKMLMTSNGDDIKKIECPVKMSWQQLEHNHHEGPYCSRCDRSILDTTHLSEQEIVEHVLASPAGCLAVDMDRVTVIFSKDELNGF
jgi:hypothetical protein